MNKLFLIAVLGLALPLVASSTAISPGITTATHKQPPLLLRSGQPPQLPVIPAVIRNDALRGSDRPLPGILHEA